jgi:hypothetical protein
LSSILSSLSRPKKRSSSTTMTAAHRHGQITL